MQSEGKAFLYAKSAPTSAQVQGFEAFLSEKYGKTNYIDKKLIMHRIHAHNTCGKSNIKNAIVFRCKLFNNYRFADRKYKSFVKGRA